MYPKLYLQRYTRTGTVESILYHFDGIVTSHYPIMRYLAAIFIIDQHIRRYIAAGTEYHVPYCAFTLMLLLKGKAQEHAFAR